LELLLTYVVLSHSGDAVEVRETREIWHGETLWESTENRSERSGGTYETSVPFYLPDNLEKGRYKAVYLVETPHSRDVREAAFAVNGR
jgi:hypothetical protein